MEKMALFLLSICMLVNLANLKIYNDDIYDDSKNSEKKNYKINSVQTLTGIPAKKISAINNFRSTIAEENDPQNKKRNYMYEHEIKKKVLIQIYDEATNNDMLMWGLLAVIYAIILCFLFLHCLRKCI